ncbi:MAG: hypothetical protein WC819_06200 [Parcubacteria group bacterium]
MILTGILVLLIVASIFVVYFKKGVKVDSNKASLVSQMNNDFKIKLDFADKNGVSKSITRYYVSLYRANDVGEILPASPVDVATYDDEVVLRNGSNGEEREIFYSAPASLRGKYAIVVDYVNEVGVPANSLVVGNYELNGNYTDFLEIFPETCSFHIDGEPENKTYTIVQGVDVKTDENLVATCSVKSHFTKDVSVTPRFINFERKDFYAEENIKQESKSLDVITFGPDEMKKVSFSVPKALKPQAYDGALSFVDSYGSRVSTKTFFHYVVAGESAGIESVILNKDNYVAGESANVTVAYFGSTDGFSDSRLGGTKNGKLTLEIDLKNNNGDSCLAGVKSYNIDPMVYESTFTLDVKSDCKNSFVEAIIKGENDVILGSEIFLHAK